MKLGAQAQEVKDLMDTRKRTKVRDPDALLGREVVYTDAPYIVSFDRCYISAILTPHFYITLIHA